MQEVQHRRVVREIASPTKSSESGLGTSERVVRVLIMGAFIAVLGFEVWLLWQAWQIF